jgi:hypothetical protein
MILTGRLPSGAASVAAMPMGQAKPRSTLDSRSTACLPGSSRRRAAPDDRGRRSEHHQR